MILTNFRLPKPLLRDLKALSFALSEPEAPKPLAEVVRAALSEYVEKHRGLLESVSRAKRRHGH
jgi:hypothetical protein